MVAWIFALVDRVWERLQLQQKDKTMDEQRYGKEFKRGDEVLIRAAHLDGVEAEVLYDMIDGLWLVRVTGSHHPSGHSAEGAIYAFPTHDLEAVNPGAAGFKQPAAAEGTVPQIDSL
jgi:hypothetical protein